ncbi:MAG TPA: integrin alpha, partial [Planctomycetota bacterium]|nr:integrin alpha [Planctomycetota bacterium]
MRACWAWILVGLLASVAPAQTVLHAFTGSGSGQFGRVVAGAGDVDADGSPDVAIAAPTEDAPGGSMPSVGSVTVF